MMSMRAALVLASFSSLFGFGCSAGDDTSSSDDVASSSASEVKLLDCQKQVASCTLKARSFKDLGACTAQFQSCSSQAALDVVGAGNLLKDCRGKADACLKGAVTLTDITACRGIFDTCTADITGTAKDVLGEAVSAATSSIEKAAGVAIDTIQGAVGATGPALEAVAACQKTATSCLKGALTVNDVSACQDVFQDCAGNAVKIVDGVVAPLPGPTPSEIADGFQLCQAKSAACLKGALTSFDVSKCKNTLSTCVGNSTNLIDKTISDVNGLLPIPVLPGVSKPVNCTAQATECLLSMKSPLTCADQAVSCAK